MKNFRTLIADDSDFFRQTLKVTLQETFPTITIDEESDGDKVLGKVNAFVPDLIFMDIRLPNADGLELTKKIKATHPHIIILILTAYDIPEYREAASKYGADRFIAKDSLNRLGLEVLIKSYQKV